MGRSRTATDSVSLEALTPGGGAAGGGKMGGLSTQKLVNFKILIAVFVIFALVVSDVFTNNVVSNFRGALHCRTPTSYGVVIQGIFLVIFYVLALYMIQGDII